MLLNLNMLVAISKDSKTLLQQCPPVVNCGCWLMQVDLYNGYKMVVVVVKLCVRKLWVVSTINGNYLRQGGYTVVVVCQSVCLSVSSFVQKLPNGFA